MTKLTKRCSHVLGMILFLFGCGSQVSVPEPKTIAIEGMSPGVLVGDLLFAGQPSASALERLASDGYRTVLSTRSVNEVPWNEQAKVEALGMKFVSIPMTPPVNEITDEQVRGFAQLMQKAERPIVLHCGSGNRVSGLWAVWLIENQNMNIDQALALAEKTGMKGVRAVVEKRLRSRNNES